MTVLMRGQYDEYTNYNYCNRGIIYVSIYLILIGMASRQSRVKRRRIWSRGRQCCFMEAGVFCTAR